MTVLDLATRWAKPPRIIVVENDAAEAKTVSQLLSSYQCDVDVVPEAGAALQALADNDYDLVFIDTSLPGSAIVARALKRISPSTPLLVIADQTSDWLSEILECGTVTVLRKPVGSNPDVLKDTLSMFKIKALPRPVPPLLPQANASIA